jgi:hypothetical protein
MTKNWDALLIFGEVEVVRGSVMMMFVVVHGLIVMRFGMVCCSIGYLQWCAF